MGKYRKLSMKFSLKRSSSTNASVKSFAGFPSHHFRSENNSNITSNNVRPLVSDNDSLKLIKDFEKALGMKLIDLSKVKKLQSLSLCTKDVNGIAFGKNSILVAASSDKTTAVCKWKVGTGYVPTEFSPLQGHKYSVSCVDISPYGAIIATVSIDGNVFLWDASTGDRLNSFVAPGNPPLRVCQFSPRSTFLLTAGDSGHLYIWDLQKRVLFRDYEGHEEAIHAACFSPDDSYIASGCSAGVINLWNTKEENGKPIFVVESSHDLGVTSMNFAPAVISTDDENASPCCLMISGGNDQLIKLWNVSLLNPSRISILKVLSGHSETIYAVQFSPVGGFIASGSGDKTVRLWDLNGKCQKVLEGHSRYVTSVSISPDGRLLASGSNDKKVNVWDLTGSISVDDEMKITTLSQGSVEVNLTHKDIWPQYEKLCTTKALHEEKAMTLKQQFEVPKVDFNSCAFMGSSIVVAAASSSKCVYGWNMDTSEQIDIAPFCTHNYSVNSVCYCPSSNVTASASTDGTVNLFNTKEKIGSLYHPSGGALRTCCFSSDGSYVLAAGDDEKASLWDRRSQKLVMELVEHTAAIHAACLTFDSYLAATGCVSGYLKLWSIKDGRTDSKCSVKTITAHELGVTCAEFSPKYVSDLHSRKYILATGGNDSLIKVWSIELEIGETMEADFDLLHTLTDHGGVSVMGVAFAPSGKIFASCAGDKTIRLWDTKTGTCLYVAEGHKRYVSNVKFAAGGTLIASCSGDHTVKIWQLHGHLARKATSVYGSLAQNAIKEWSPDNVSIWLEEVGFPQLSPLAVELKIDGGRLLHFDDQYLLSKLSLDDADLRLRLLTELEWLKSLGCDRNDLEHKEQITAPVEFFCPITHELMVEPVTTCDGYSYERTAITEWFLTGKKTSPLTNVELDNMTLTPNFDLQNKISEFLSLRLNKP